MQNASIEVHSPPSKSNDIDDVPEHLGRVVDQGILEDGDHRFRGMRMGNKAVDDTNKRIRIVRTLDSHEIQRRALWLPALVMLTIFLLSTAQPAFAENKALTVELTCDPFLEDFNDPVNIDNMTENQTTRSEWTRDLGADAPNGTYYGTLFPPALFEHNLAPTWRKNKTAQGQDGQFSYVMLSSHFNLSQQKIMAGTSEWWVRTPVHPDSIEAYFGISLCIFKNVDNASLVNIYGNYSCGTDRQSSKPRAAHNGYAPDVIAEYDSTAGPWQSGDKFSKYTPPKDMRIANGHVYLQVNAVLEPAVDYVLSLIFRLPQNGKLMTYWTTSETPAGKWTAIQTAEMRIYYDGGTSSYVQKLDGYLTELPLDLDWSFIFVEGVGMGGLFGKKIQIPENHTLTVYPFFNTSRNGSQYMSFMLPFISEGTANVTPQVYPADGQDTSWNFTDGNWYFNPEIEYELFLKYDALTGNNSVFVSSTQHLWVGKYLKIMNDTQSQNNFITGISDDEVTLLYEFVHDYNVSDNARLWMKIPMGWNYSDYIIFSTNSTLDWSTFDDDDRWNVEIEFLFNDPITLTLLCYYEGNRPKQLWSNIQFNNTSLNPYFFPFTFGRPGTPSHGDTYRMHYKVFCSARGTNGQWAIQNTTASGVTTYTHYFPSKVFLSSAHWYIENSTTSVDVDLDGGWYLGKYFNIAAKKVWGAIKGGATAIWDGGAAVVGFLKDALSKLWQGMVKLGQWLYTHIVEFIGNLWNFIINAYDTIVSFWQSAKYLIAPIIMMAIIAVGGKLSSGMMKGRGDT